MKLLRVSFSLFASIGLIALAHGQPKPPAPKSPADLAADEFYKLRGDKEAKPDQARMAKVIKSGLDFLEQNPTYGKAPALVNDVATFAATITDKKLVTSRSVYVATLRYELLTRRQKDGLSDDQKVVFAALEASLADFETREAVSPENISNLRDKIDTLAAMPGASRFLVDRERGYFDILTRGRTVKLGEAHLKKLLDHPDKGVATMAREEMNLVEVRKAPYDLKFTALDGKECDLAALRGKVVALVFFNATNEGSVKALTVLKELTSLYKKEFAVVIVSFDKEADREKVEKVVKDNKLTWPVYFDGKEAKNDWCPKLNVKRAPAIVLFDQKGMFLTNSQRGDRLEAELKRLAGIK